jgi:L-ascorbate metabolism protein UlaG (beta-lactamase superfamily)
MRITKLGHSCVLVETPDRVGLFDPGAWADKSLIDAIEHIDRIIYTHEHQDHFDIEILKSLTARFPQAHVVCNDSIAEKIKEAGVSATVRGETACTQKFTSPHDSRLPMIGAEAPMQTGFHFKYLFTHPGDNNKVTETKDVLAMPFVAPWGIPREAIETVLRLQPKYVLPIHDWLYSDDAKEWLQNILESQLEPQGIKVLPNKIGHVIEL